MVLAPQGTSTREFIYDIGLKDLVSTVITSTNFQEMFTIVRAARNTIFHHREIAKQPKLNSHLVDLLDIIGVHLPSSYEDIIHQIGSSHKFELARQDHHYGLTPERRPYRLTYTVGTNAAVTLELAGTCESEVIVSFMHSQKSSSIIQLNSLQVTALDV